MSASQETQNSDEVQQKPERRAGLGRWLRTIVLSLLALNIAAHVIGWLIPAEFVVTRTARFTQSAEELWPVISNIEADPEWRPSILEVRVKENSESGTAFDSLREHEGISCIGTEQIKEMDPPWRLVRTINGFPDEPSGIWTLELSPFANGTELTVKARVVSERHPFERWYRLVSSKAEDQVDSYLLWVTNKINTPVRDGGASPTGEVSVWISRINSVGRTFWKRDHLGYPRTSIVPAVLPAYGLPLAIGDTLLVELVAENTSRTTNLGPEIPDPPGG